MLEWEYLSRRKDWAGEPGYRRWARTLGSNLLNRVAQPYEGGVLYAARQRM